MPQASPGGPLSVALFSAGTTGSSQPINVKGKVYLTLFLTASAALSAGTVILEESDDPSYGGTWSLIATYTLSSVFASAGGKSAQHQPVSCYAWVRARIGTTAVGGTLAAALEAC